MGGRSEPENPFPHTTSQLHSAVKIVRNAFRLLHDASLIPPETGRRDFRVTPLALNHGVKDGRIVGLHSVKDRAQ
jgi:hypothetical protein